MGERGGKGKGVWAGGGRRRGSVGWLVGWLCVEGEGGTVLGMKVLVIWVLIGGALLWGEEVLGQGRLSYPAVGEEGMVAARNIYGAETGVEILKAGGNAMDAAVGAAYALAVTLPSAGNIGGGGFLVYYHAEEGEVYALDFRETAPAGATRDMFLGEDGEVDEERARASHLSSGVPGSVAGLSAALERFGTMPLGEVMVPAIGLAEEGFAFPAQQARSLKEYAKRVGKFESSREIFFKGDGSPHGSGDLVVMEDLGRTLRLIQEEGTEAFYEGESAELIVAEMESGGGLISREDLAGYAPTWREPVTGTYRGLTIYSMPPPSSGGVHLIQMLNVLEGYDLRAMGWHSAASMHVMAEAMRRAFADRSELLADADFYEVPVGRLTAKGYADALRGSIDLERATPSAEVRPGALLSPDGTNTTALAVIDAEGNAVSLTTTINTAFGSGIVVRGAGFLLNNEMDDFAAKPGAPNAFGLLGGKANEVEAGKRPLSSMTPTIVMKDGSPMLLSGGAGGSRIITGVLQVIVNVGDFGLNVQEAVDAPRLHHQWLPDELSLEKGFSQDTVVLLEGMGHEVMVGKPRSAVVGIEVVRGEDGRVIYEGASDARREGVALGY
jgi:gamma-glutamyltranspeptidase/glutathione hydrolase